MSWADEDIFRRLPKGPGRSVSYDDFAGGGALRFSADFLAVAQQKPPASSAAKGKKKQGGQDMSQVYRCRACNVDSSGPLSFAQHWCAAQARPFSWLAGASGLNPAIALRNSLLPAYTHPARARATATAPGRPGSPGWCPMRRAWCQP